MATTQEIETENGEQASAQAADQAKRADARKVVVEVLGPDESPISSAKISVGRFKPTVFTTDQSGSATVEIGEMKFGEVVYQFTDDVENVESLPANWSPRELKSLAEESAFREKAITACLVRAG